MRRFTAIRHILPVVGIVLLLLILTAVTVRVTRLQRSVTTLQESVSREVERQHQLTQLLESNQRTATDHLQEVRGLLNLPTARYRFSHTDASPESDPDPDAVFFRALDRLLFHYELRDLRAHMHEILHTDSTVSRFLDRRSLEARPGSEAGSWQIRDARFPKPLLTIRTPGPDSGARRPARVLVEPFRGESLPLSSSDDSLTLEQRLLEELEPRIEELQAIAVWYESARASLISAVESPEVRSVLTDKGFTVSIAEDEQPASVTVRGDTGTDEQIARIDPEERRILIDEKPAPPDPTERLASRIADLDLRPREVRADEAARERILAIAEDPAFREYLSESGMRLSRDPRETLDFYAFDLEDRDGNALGSFAVLKDSGELYVLDSEDVMITGFQSLLRAERSSREHTVTSSDVSQELPEGFPPGFRGGAARDGTDLLLIGTHEREADAIMLVHLGAGNTISMISIPRDLYHRGRKLSHVFRIYGARTFTRRVGEIIDRPLDGYVEIDMYAFIEVVDELGGVAITLEEPLVDPEYRVRDDGEWGTLYYPAGTHTLNGIEALRIARSRTTTTDFGRAQRQQDILRALRHRITSLHAGNLDQVYRLFRTLYEYVDTDLSAWELTQYFLAYRDAPIRNQAGMTFDNILYSTYSNVHNRGITMEEAEEIEDFFYGQWILLPRNDDWSVIPWFVEQHIEP